jgi:hypothetical protein
MSWAERFVDLRCLILSAAGRWAPREAGTRRQKKRLYYKDRDAASAAGQVGGAKSRGGGRPRTEENWGEGWIDQ